MPPAGAVIESRFGLRNPELMYYLMFLKVFLLAMGANGTITLSHHTGAARTFLIWNFIVLYLYAIPFFIIKFIKLKKALQSSVRLDETGLELRCGERTVTRLPYAAISQALIEKETGAAVITGNEATICLGSTTSKLSPFYAAGIDQIVEKIREKASDKIRSAASLKDEIRQQAL